jgi:hypothetical protein
VAITVLILCGCERDDRIVAYQAPKESPPATEPAPATQPRVPEGWVQQPPQAMRVASFKTPGGGDVIVTRFGKESFRDKLSNINRWRGFVELPPIDDADAVKPQPITVAGAPATLYEFAGEKKKQYVAVIERGEAVVFVRFIGPTAAVDAQKQNFDSFLSSFPF